MNDYPTPATVIIRVLSAFASILALSWLVLWLGKNIWLLFR